VINVLPLQFPACRTVNRAKRSAPEVQQREPGLSVAENPGASQLDACGLCASLGLR